MELQGQEALDYIMSNPSANFQVMGGQQQLFQNRQIQDMFRQQELDRQMQMQMQQQNLAQAQQQQQDAKGGGGILGFAKNIGKSLIDPFVDAGKLATYGGATLADMFQGGSTNRQAIEDQFYDGDFNLGKELLQTGAGLGSYLIPGGVGARMLLGGAVSGGLGALAESDLDDLGGTLQNVALGAGLGGVTAGVGGKLLGRLGSKTAGQADEVLLPGLQAGLGQADDNVGRNFISRGLRGKADELADSSTIRNFGNLKPSANEGGNATLKFIRKQGLDNTDPESLIKSADNIVTQNSPRINEMVNNATVQGKVIDREDVLMTLRNRLGTAQDAKVKGTISNVIENAKVSLPEEITPNQLLQFKRDLGSRAYKGVNAAEKSTADFERKLYQSVDNALEKTVPGQGFKDINRQTSQALKARSYAERASSQAKPGRAFNPFDAFGGGAGFIASGGNPVGAAAGLAAQKALTSNRAQQMMAGGMRRVANFADNLGSIPVNIPGQQLAGQITGALPAQQLQRAGGMLPSAIGQAQARNNVADAQFADQEAEIMNQMNMMGNPANMSTLQQLFNTPMAQEAIMAQQMPVEAQQPQLGTFEDYLAQASQMLPGADISDVMRLGQQLERSAVQRYKMAAQEGQQEGEGTNENLANAIAEMERLYGVGTDKSLSAGEQTAGIAGLLDQVTQRARSFTDQDFENRKTAYNEMTSLALGIINQARGAGTLNEGEAQVLMQNMPNEFSSETQAKSWFENVRRMLSSRQPSQTQQQAPQQQQMDPMMQEAMLAQMYF